MKYNATPSRAAIYRDLPRIKQYFRIFMRKQYHDGLVYYLGGKLKNNILCDFQRYMISKNLMGSTINWKVRIMSTYFKKIKKHGYLITPKNIHDERTAFKKKIPLTKLIEMILTEPKYYPSARERNVQIIIRAAETCKKPTELLEEKDCNGLYLCRNLDLPFNERKNGKMTYHSLWRVLGGALKRVGLYGKDGYSPDSFSCGIIYDMGIEGINKLM